MTDFSDPGQVLSFVRNSKVPYFSGAIFPSEMAFFIYECERAGATAIAESGRQDGYSTALLALYGAEKGIPVVSVDYEDPAYAERALACRARLERYQDLRLEVGDALERFPVVLRELRARRIALLVDGPKKDEAIYLSAAACALAPVCVVAHHNTAPTMAWYPHFIHRFHDAERLEESPLTEAAGFEEFRDWEREVIAVDQRAVREVDDSSLACSRLKQPGPSRSYLSGPSAAFGVRASVCYLWWIIGCPGGARTLRLLWSATGHRQ
jgi:predicted O-methyltransferase YrrM